LSNLRSKNNEDKIKQFLLIGTEEGLDKHFGVIMPESSSEIRSSFRSTYYMLPRDVSSQPKIGVTGLIDTHAHLLPQFVDNIEKLIQNARTTGLLAVINSAIEPRHYSYARDLTQKHEGFVYSSLGFSPSHIKTIDFNIAYEIIKNDTTLVAIGEVGLDYHWIKDTYWQKRERTVFLKFIELANERQKPLVIHSRKAETDCIELLEKNAKVPVLMHCFTGTMDEIDRCLDSGWLVSIPTAVVNRKKHRRIARKVPLESLVVETDTPFLSPIKGERNQPANVRYAIQEVALLKNSTFDEVKNQTTKNAKEFYRL
jgi:TatD DNase family protein